MQTSRKHWLTRFSITAGSLLLFAILGWVMVGFLESFTFVDLLILISVLLVHELGHYAGMRVFGYRNVQMFFIPLFGAAVSGHGIRASVARHATALLLGPVPGLLLGSVFGFGPLPSMVCLATRPVREEPL